MKNKLRILTTAITLFMIKPAFAQEVSRPMFCCVKETPEERQIAIDPSQWVTAGKESEFLGNMTTLVRMKVHHDLMAVSQDQATAVKGVRHSKKSAHSKQ